MHACLHDVVLLILTVVDCGVLTNPANGQVSHPTGTTFGKTAMYSCNTGYNLMGDNTRTCQATGKWSGSEPTCQSMLQTGYLNRVCVGQAYTINSEVPINYNYPMNISNYQNLCHQFP